MKRCIPGLSECEISVSRSDNLGRELTTTQFPTQEDTREGQIERGRKIRSLAESILNSMSRFFDNEDPRPEPYLSYYDTMPKKLKNKASPVPVDVAAKLAAELGIDLRDMKGEIAKTTLAKERKDRAAAYPSPPKRTDYDSSERFQHEHTKYNVKRANEIGVQVRPCRACSLKGNPCKIDISSLVPGKRTFKCAGCYSKKIACSASDKARDLALRDEELLLRLDETSPDSEKWTMLMNIIGEEERSKQDQVKEKSQARLEKSLDQVRLRSDACEVADGLDTSIGPDSTGDGKARGGSGVGKVQNTRSSGQRWGFKQARVEYRRFLGHVQSGPRNRSRSDQSNEPERAG